MRTDEHLQEQAIDIVRGNLPDDVELALLLLTVGSAPRKHADHYRIEPDGAFNGGGEP